MSALRITLIVWTALGTFATVALVGQPRKPISPGVACFTVLVNTFVCLGIARV